MNRPRPRQTPAPGGIRVSSRRGSATVEVALTLPVLILLVFGSIEASNAIFLKQAATVAAYETARVASSSGGTESAAMTRGNEILTSRSIGGGTIEITPAVDAFTVRGVEITVKVSVPANANSIGPQFYYRDTTVESTFTMSRL